MRPAGLLYGLDDRPPFAILVLTGAQHVAVITAIGVIFPKLVLAHAGLDPEQGYAVLGLSMLALGPRRGAGIGAALYLPLRLRALRAA